MSFGGGDLLLNKWRQDSRGWKVRPYPITMWKMLAIHAPNNWVKGASVFHLFNNQQTAIYWILKMYLILTRRFSSSCRFKVNMSEVQDDRLLSIKLCYPWCLLFILGNLTHLWWRFLISELPSNLWINSYKHLLRYFLAWNESILMTILTCTIWKCVLNLKRA